MNITTTLNFHSSNVPRITTPTPHDITPLPQNPKPAQLRKTTEAAETFIFALAHSKQYADLPWGEKICEALKCLDWVNKDYQYHPDIETFPFLELSQATKDSLQKVLAKRLTGTWVCMGAASMSEAPLEYTIEMPYHEFLQFIKSATEFLYSPVESIAIIGSQVPRTLEFFWMKQNLLNIASTSPALTALINQAEIDFAPTGSHKSDTDTFFDASRSIPRHRIQHTAIHSTMAQQALEAFIFRHLAVLDFKIIYDNDTDDPISSFTALAIHLSNPYNINRKDGKAITKIEVANNAVPWLKGRFLSGRGLNEFYKDIQNNLKGFDPKTYGFVKKLLLIGCTHIFQKKYTDMLKLVEGGVFYNVHNTTFKRTSYHMECRDDAGDRFDFTFVESIDTATIRVLAQDLRLEIQPAIAGGGAEAARIKGTHTAILHNCCGMLSFVEDAVADHTKWAFYWWKVLKGQQLVGSSYKETELHQTLLNYCKKSETKTIGLAAVLKRWLQKSIKEPDPALAFSYFFNPLTHLPEGFSSGDADNLWKILAEHCAPMLDPLLEPLATPLLSGVLEHDIVASFLHILAFQYLITPENTRQHLPYKACFPRHGDKRMIRLTLSDHSFLFHSDPAASYKRFYETYREVYTSAHPRDLERSKALDKLMEGFQWSPLYALNAEATIFYYSEEINLPLASLHQTALDNLNSEIPVLIQHGYSLLLLSLYRHTSEQSWMNAWTYLPRILEHEKGSLSKKNILDMLIDYLEEYEPSFSGQKEQTFRAFLRSLADQPYNITIYHQALVKTHHTFFLRAAFKLNPLLSAMELTTQLVELAQGNLEAAFACVKKMRDIGTIEGKTWTSWIEALGNASIKDLHPKRYLNHFYSLIDILVQISKSHPAEKTALERLSLEWIQDLLKRQKTEAALLLNRITMEKLSFTQSDTSGKGNLVDHTRRDLEINLLVEGGTTQNIAGNLKALLEIINYEKQQETLKAYDCLTTWVLRLCGNEGGKQGIQKGREILDIPLTKKLFAALGKPFSSFCAECIETAMKAWLPKKKPTGVYSLYEFAYHASRDSQGSLTKLLYLLINILHDPNTALLPPSFALFLKNNLHDIKDYAYHTEQPDLLLDLHQGLVKCQFPYSLKEDFQRLLFKAASVYLQQNPATADPKIRLLITSLRALDIDQTPAALEWCMKLAHELFYWGCIENACLLFNTVVKPKSILQGSFYHVVLPSFTDRIPLIFNTLVENEQLEEAIDLLYYSHESQSALWKNILTKIVASHNMILTRKAINYAKTIPKPLNPDKDYCAFQEYFIKILMDVYLETENIDVCRQLMEALQEVGNPHELHHYVKTFLDKLDKSKKKVTLHFELIIPLFFSSHTLQAFQKDPKEKFVYSLKFMTLARYCEDPVYLIEFCNLLYLLLATPTFPPEFSSQISAVLIPLVRQVPLLLTDEKTHQTIVTCINKLVGTAKDYMTNHEDILEILEALTPYTSPEILCTAAEIAKDFMIHKLSAPLPKMKKTEKQKDPIKPPQIDKKIQGKIRASYSKLIAQLLQDDTNIELIRIVPTFLMNVPLQKILGDKQIGLFNEILTRASLNILYISPKGIQPFVKDFWNYLENIDQNYFESSPASGFQQPLHHDVAKELKEIETSLLPDLMSNINRASSKQILTTYVYAMLRYIHTSCRLKRPLDTAIVKADIEQLIKHVDEQCPPDYLPQTSPKELEFTDLKNEIAYLLSLKPLEHETRVILLTNIWFRLTSLITMFPKQKQELSSLLNHFVFRKMALFSAHPRMYQFFGVSLLTQAESINLFLHDVDANNRVKLHLHLNFCLPAHIAVKPALQKKYFLEILDELIESKESPVITRAAYMVTCTHQTLFKDDYPFMIIAINKVMDALSTFPYCNNDMFDAIKQFSRFLSTFLTQIPPKKCYDQLSLWNKMNALLVSSIKGNMSSIFFPNASIQRFETALRFTCQAMQTGWLKNDSPDLIRQIEALEPYAFECFYNFQHIIQRPGTPLNNIIGGLNEWTDKLNTIYSMVGSSPAKKWIETRRMIWTYSAKLIYDTLMLPLRTANGETASAIISTTIKFLNNSMHLNIFGGYYKEYLILIDRMMLPCLQYSIGTNHKNDTFRSFFHLLTTSNEETKPSSDLDEKIRLALLEEWKQTLRKS